MTMIKLRLHWKSPTGDVDLGSGFHEVLPPAGSLLVFVTDHGVVWRVVQLYFHLIMPGSQAHRSAERGQRCDPPTVYVFVEPAEGPHEP